MGRASLVPIAVSFVFAVVGTLDRFDVPLAVVAIVAFIASRGRVAGALRYASLAAFACGVLLGHTHGETHPPDARGRTERFPATLVDARAANDGRIDATLRLADGSQASANVAAPAPDVGARLVVRGKREPFDESRNPGEPAERDLAAERGISWRIARARILGSAPPDPHDASLWLARLRAVASARLHAHLGEPDATILAGALWGERGALPPDLRAEFQDTGTVHVLVTAGLHLGVVGALAYATLAALGCGRVGASLATIAVVWAYAAFSGAHLPSLRAATMLSFALLARATGRDAYSWNALAAAAIVVAALRPASVISVSFALSFSCVAAIFAFERPARETCERFGAPPFVASLLGVALATQIGTWPLTASAFLVIAPYAPLANALVVPVVGVAMIVGFAALACAPVPVLEHALDNVVASLLGWIEGTVRFFATFPGAHVIATPPPVWTIVTYDVALVFAAVALSHERRAVAMMLVACASALCLWPPRAAERNLIVTVIDVGQADAILIRTPRGRAFLVDAGGRLERGPSLGLTSSAEDIGTRTVVPFLIRAGIHHIDALLVSHPHGDHVGGAAPVLRSLGADGFADSGQSYVGHAYLDALATARTLHVPMLEPRGGDVWRTGDGVTLRFYGPTLPYLAGGRNDINENSLVFRLEYGTFRMLFTGDAGAAAEARLEERGFDLRADVLKVGHHGSSYGSTPAFVAAVRPKAALISVGRDNLFGHPAPATLATLEARGTAIYRTDRDGAIELTSDGRTFSISPFVRDAGGALTELRLIGSAP